MTARKPPEVERQPPGRCTWCGHPSHPLGCNRLIRIATGPSGGQGRKVPTALIACPCTNDSAPAIE